MQSVAEKTYNKTDILPDVDIGSSKRKKSNAAALAALRGL